MQARRPLLGRWIVASLVVHATLYLANPPSPLRFGGTPGPVRDAEGPSASLVPFSSLAPLQVVEVTEVSASPSGPTSERPLPGEPGAEPPPPTADEPPSEPPPPTVDEAPADPLDLDEVLRQLQRSGAASPATELPTAPATSLTETPGGVSDPGDRGPELRRVRAVPYPADGPDLDGPQSVTVRVHVDVTGIVDAVEVLLPHPSEALNRAAREAARGYRFAPALTDGRPVAAWSRPFEIPFDRD